MQVPALVSDKNVQNRPTLVRGDLTIEKQKDLIIWHCLIQRDETIANKLMYIPNDDTQNYLFCSLKLVVEMFEHVFEVPKVVKPMNKKTLI